MLQRKLSVRQIAMLAIGGVIGTSLFYGAGVAVHQAGPGGALLAYAIIGVMVYFLMTSLGEMATSMPTAGSFYVYAEKTISKPVAFALGFNYWYNWAITLAVEAAAFALVIHFWLPHSIAWHWSLLFLLFVFCVNVLSVNVFGETEYWFSWLKLIAIFAFIIIGILLVFGLLGQAPVGVSNWQIGDAPFHMGFLGFFGVFLIAGFSFQGTEMVGVAAGEAKDPKQSIKSAMRMVFWRIVIFYLLTLLVIGLLIPYSSTNLIGHDAIVSPFTLVFKQAGLPFAAGILNAVILVTVVSTGNSSLYAASRILWYMSTQNEAPQCFAKVSNKGVPVLAVLVTTLVGFVALLSSKLGSGAIFIYLLNASGLSGFITWLGVALSHYHFRKKYIAQGNSLNDLPYRAKLFPFGPLFAFVLCAVIVLGQFYVLAQSDGISWHGILLSYSSIPLFFALWLWRRFKN